MSRGALTPKVLLDRLCEVYRADNLNALARHLRWDAKTLYRWEKAGEGKDGPNFWHTVELLELAGWLTPNGDSVPRPLPRELAGRLEDAAAAIASARDLIRRLEPPRQVDAG